MVKRILLSMILSFLGLYLFGETVCDEFESAAEGNNDGTVYSLGIPCVFKSNPKLIIK